MVDPFVAALTAIFNAPGSVAAVYTPPGGAALPVRIIRSQESAIAGDVRLVADTMVFDVRRSEVAKPAIGATLQILDVGGQPVVGEAFKINGAPLLDVEGLTWRCGAQPV